MAGDTRDAETSGGDGGGATATSEPPKKLPPGVVLGKDGKPCRSCTSGAAFAAWASQTKSSLKGPTPAAPATMPSDCPPDVEQLGRSSWTLLHSIAATYPEKPSASDQSDILGFVKLFSKLYPCWVCAEDFQQYIRREPVKAGSRDEFGTWLCEAHNDVNTKLGKPTFNCAKWQERWRTGWKDGRCD